MNSNHKTWRTAALVTTAAASALLVLAGCAGGGAPSPESSAPATGSGDSELAAKVAASMEPASEYPVPTEPIADVTAIKGKTVYYIPITNQAPKFSIVQKGLADALAAVGANLQVCDGKGTPTDISACITQATDAGAAAIVTDAIYYAMVANALDAAQAAGVKVLNTNQGPADGFPESGTLSYAVEAGNGGASPLAEWVALDSEGAGQILANVSVDGPAPKRYFAQGQEVYSEYCPDCKITVNEVTSSNFAQIPSSTSSALLKDPNIEYVYVQFEQYVQVSQGGVEQTGRIGSVKGLTGAATLGSLQALNSGTFLYAAVADASTFNGWIDADAVIRMVAGEPVPEYTIPERLFTRDNIGDIELTEAAQSSGAWFGPTDFPEKFKTLWGVD